MLSRDTIQLFSQFLTKHCPNWPLDDGLVVSATHTSKKDKGNGILNVINMHAKHTLL